MRIGCSLSMDVLCGTPRNAAQQALLAGDGLPGLLATLRDAGVSSIEMRTVRAAETTERVRAAAAAVTDARLALTVHGELRDTDAASFFAQLQPALDAQPYLIVTVHALRNRATDAENVSATRALLDAYRAHIEARALPVRIALENNRISKPDMPSVSPAGVLRTLDTLDTPVIGVCWDFGHLYSDHTHFPALVPDILPDARFAARAIHTHIHAMGTQTHFPLGRGALPLAAYLRLLLQTGYQGLFHLEPEPERWFAQYPDVRAEIVQSAVILRETLADLSAAHM